MTSYTRPDRDLAKGHPLLQERLPAAIEAIRAAGYPLVVEEIYRPDLRQQWLWAQGRTAPDCAAKGIPIEFARHGHIVTNAWSAALSPHGFTLQSSPAAAAADLIPVGADGLPWTPDDAWEVFVGQLEPLLAAHGLRHFHAPGKQVWDKPHVQLIEWSDELHTVLLP